MLLRMRARPVNPSDLSMLRGRYGQLPPLPATPGLEGVGEVEALGAGVDSVAAGQRVVPLGASPGTWAERMVVPAARLVPVPDGVSDDAAAQLVVNPLSAWVLLVDELDVQPGEWLLQNAAGSTLGRIVLQLARARGFRTINVVRRAEQGEELLALGADEVIATDRDDLGERVREITGGEGVAKAIDAVGGELAGRMAAALAPRGTLITYGRLSGEASVPLDYAHPDLRGHHRSRVLARALVPGGPAGPRGADHRDGARPDGRGGRGPAGRGPLRPRGRPRGGGPLRASRTLGQGAAGRLTGERQPSGDQPSARTRRRGRLKLSRTPG